MAADSLLMEAYVVKKKKSQSTGIHRRRGKRLVGQKVEVRSFGVGFQGSWHSATVTGWRNSVLRVEYDYLTVDGDSEKLVELVDVSSVIDDGDCDIKRKRCRGLIRPVPSPSAVNKWSLHYGLCVDVCIKDSWLEGVVIDHDDGFDERLIFFPDSGNQQTISLEQLRVTQDWNEGLGCWTSRDNWLFLESLEEHGLECLSGNISLRQIWHNVRAKEEFEKGDIDWTFREKLLWDYFVREVIRDMGLTAEHVSNVIETHQLNEVSNKRRKISVPGDHEENIEPMLASAEDDGLGTSTPLFHANGPNVGVSNAGLFAPIVRDEENFEVGTKNIAGKEFMVQEAIGTVQDAENRPGSYGSDRMSDEPCRDSESYDEDSWDCHDFTAIDEMDHLTNRESLTDDSTCNVPKLIDPAPGKADWQPAGIDIVPGAQYCPEALVNYYAGSHQRKSKETITKARMHLLYMGWKIEFSRNKFRYTSPAGHTKYSLVEICKCLLEQKREAWNKVVKNGHQDMVNVPGELLNSNLFQEAVSRFHKQRQRKVTTPSDVSSPCSKTPSSSIPEMEVLSPDHIPDVSVDEAEYCPQAVIEWNQIGSDREKWKQANHTGRDLIVKARKHLLAVGWKIWSKLKKSRYELCYTSPNGKTYISLVTACKACVEEGNLYKKMTRTNGIIVGEEPNSLATGEKFSPEKMCFEANGHSEKSYADSPGLSQSRGLKFGNVRVKGVRRHQELQNGSPLKPGCIQNRSVHLQTRKDETAIAECNPKRTLVEQGHQSDGSFQTSALQSTKRARTVLVPSQSKRRSVLSYLIDNNVVLPEDYVYYRGKNDKIMAEGQITREGIRCNCCQEIFGLTGFEAHAGSTNHRPAANIFLEDGRSLFQCQKQIEQDNEPKSTELASQKSPKITSQENTKLASHEKIKRKRKRTLSDNLNDHICSVCHYGGTLLLCEQCPSAFHLSCLGLKDLPEGQWFCPSCRCGICQQRELNGDIEQFSEKKIMYCHQCERKYHMGCIRRRGLFKLESCPNGSWFCSEKCEQIFVGLHRILGQSIPVGVDNLSWTILKSSEDGYHHLDGSGTGSETITEHRRKLKLSVDVLHECFGSINEPGTNKDLVEDVVFNKRSELNRLNFWGFYTVLLEREDELISVATVRIYGEKAAEVPLVGTRFQYRRQGMCRILISALEKKFAELGVERLLLPAAPEVLKTWIKSFGYSKLKDSERLMFLEHTFLDFQDTTMCQKILRH